MSLKCGGHFDWAKIAKHSTKLLPSLNPVHLSHRKAGPTVQKFLHPELEGILPWNATDPAQPEWAEPAVFALKKDRPLLICVQHTKLNNLTRR